MVEFEWNIEKATFLPIHRMGRGTVRRTGEGYCAVAGYPSTTLWVVPLPKRRLGRIYDQN
jgi:hypothetical protein